MASQRSRSCLKAKFTRKMKTDIRRLVVFFCLFSCAFALLTTATKGQESAAQHPQFVYIEVSGSEIIANVIKSGLLKRLREFKDVVIAPTIGEADNVFFF